VIALKMVKTGDFNPHWFRKPTFPIYLIASGYAVGYLHACSKLEMSHTQEISSQVFPFYANRTVVLPSRVLYSGLSVLTMLFIGIIAFKIYKVESLLFLTPLILSFSTLYLYLSWSYLNVDIVGCFFSILLLFFLFQSLDTKNVLAKGILAGVLCGATVASKYNLFPIMVPCILCFILYHRERWMALSLLMIGSTVVTFVLLAPYTLFDLPVFLEFTGKEVRHYQEGHKGHDGQPGIGQLLYYLGALREDFGWILSGLGAFGVVYMFRLQWEKTLILLSYPATLLLFMCAQKVHFPRNIVSVYVLMSLAVALGVVGIFRKMCPLLAKQRYFNAHPVLRCLCVGGAIGLIAALTLPVRKIASAYDLHPESRNVATTWIRDNVPGGSTILIPKELSIDPRALQGDYRVGTVTLSDENISVAEIQNQYKGAYILIPRFRDEKSNEALRTVQPIEEFGDREIGPNGLGKGSNPRFAIAKL
jgi:4-amino-4-deoxy-L-arabinose transferase-like glycosyltransferase